MVLATYQGARHLAQQLASLAAQTRRPDELVVRDDGSTDETVDLLRAFAATAPFEVRILVAEENEGYARNFVAAAGHARGELLLFCDQDDVWHRRKLEVVATWAALRPGWAYFHDYRLVSTDPSRAAPSCFELLARRGFSPAVSFKGSSMAVSREFVEEWGWPPAGSGISHDFWVALLSTGLDRRRTLLQVLSDHRLHKTNASGWIAAGRDRRFSVEGAEWSDTATLVDLVLRDERPGWTEVFLSALTRRGGPAPTPAVQRLREVLETNARGGRPASTG